MELEKIVKQDLVANKLVKKGDIVLVGLSGGPDSTALLYILHKLSSTMKFSLAACYINHMIRPRAAKKEIEYCWKLCQKLKIDFHMINEDIPNLAKELKVSVETAGHQFRRQALQQLALEDDYDKIALGHHLDDSIETILFRIFRGTGPGGLNPLKALSENVIRPLINIEKSEIEKYCRSRKLKPLLDKSNLDLQYSRNQIRHKIIPLIENHFGDKYKKAIVNFSKIVSDESEFLAEITARNLNKIVSRTSGGKIVLEMDKFSLLDDWLKRRILKQVLSELTGHWGAGSFKEIEHILNLTISKKKALDLAGNIRILKEGNELIFIPRKTIIDKQLLSLYTMAVLDGLGCRIVCREQQKSKTVKKIQKNGFKIHIDRDKISFPLRVRSIRTGDRFKPLGMKGRKKVGNFLTDWKVPSYIRDEIVVIEDKLGIIWLVGYQISDRVKIDIATKRILEIESIGKRQSVRRKK